jgi:hypothetical protein
MQCGTHAIKQSSSLRALSNDVNMADTSFVMEMTTCRVEHDVLSTCICRERQASRQAFQLHLLVTASNAMHFTGRCTMPHAC